MMQRYYFSCNHVSFSNGFWVSVLRPPPQGLSVAPRYADAYNAFASVLMKYKYTPHTQDIKANMEFCKKPLPWSKKLRNHDMGYWHSFMLYRFGGRRKVMLSEDVYIATDN